MYLPGRIGPFQRNTSSNFYALRGALEWRLEDSPLSAI